MDAPMTMKGVRNIHRKRVIPTPIGLPFMSGVGNQVGKVTLRLRNVPAMARRTKTDTIPFQNSAMAKVPAAATRER
jgi:hypothetical protein